MSAATMSDEVDSLVSLQQIANVLALHSRGVDRADARLLESAYHPDATVEYGFFNGPASELAVILAAAQKGQPVTMHRTSNLWIKVNGDRAMSESYVIAYAEQPGDPSMQRLIGGRYLDRHERRHNRWAMSHRKYVLDFNINRPGTSQSSDASIDLLQFGPRGGQAGADAGRALLALYAAGFTTEGVSDLSSTSVDARVQNVLAKQTLHELNMAYARAADRADAELMASIFHHDATVVTGSFNCAGHDYATKVTDFIRQNLTRCFHSVANEWFDIRGDEAVGESYVIAAITAGGIDTFTGGRYVDRYEKRDGTWKIKHRVFVQDFSNAQPTSHQNTGLYAALSVQGKFGHQDPVYGFWQSPLP